MSVRALDDYLRHIQNNMHPLFIKNIAKEMQEKDKEIKRLKEEYMILQNASDEVEEELQQRIGKAIDCIYNELLVFGDETQWEDWEVRKYVFKVLDILKGSDKE